MVPKRPSSVRACLEVDEASVTKRPKRTSGGVFAETEGGAERCCVLGSTWLTCRLIRSPCDATWVHVFAETDRMFLRRFTIDDGDTLVALDRNPLVRRYVEDGEPVNEAEALRTIEYWMRDYERFEVFGFWRRSKRTLATFLAVFIFDPCQQRAT
jgi:hypothetical protein